jgi:hypothetical protein
MQYAVYITYIYGIPVYTAVYIAVYGLVNHKICKHKK